MSERTRSRTPWLVWAAVMALFGGTVVLSILNGSSQEDPVWGFVGTGMLLGYATVGALLASRNPHNPIGWLMLTLGAAFSLGGLETEYAVYALVTEPGSLPGGALGAALGPSSWSVMLAVLPLLALLYPTGRVPSARWRYLPGVIVACAIAVALGSAFGPTTYDLDPRIVVANPIRLPGFAVLAGVGFVGLLAATAASVVALVLRYRHAIGEERQQIRWLAYVAVSSGTLILCGAGIALVAGDSILLAVVWIAGFVLIGIGVPVAMGIAILRYHLYDLDLVIKKTVVYGLLTASIVGIGLGLAYIVRRIAVTSSDEDILVLTGVVLGILIWPLRRAAGKIADRVVYGGRAKPYEVLTTFSARMADTYATEDVLPRMAQILAEGTGARGARIWLRVAGELRPVAGWPGDAAGPSLPMPSDVLPALPDRESAFEVRHQGELLGAVSIRTAANDPMNPSKERLVRDLASQAGLVLRNVRLIEDLRSSRQRLVAAQDQERRRIERNIHDGAQQQLVALGVQLGLLEHQIERDPATARATAARLKVDATRALEDLRDLARGIYPPLLADEGLAAALEAQARKAAIPTTIDADVVGRYSSEVEVTVYFCTLEALNNVAKYAHASSARVRLSAANGTLTFEVTDDGVGFDTSSTGYGTGLQGMADRLAALGGELEIRSGRGTGTTVAGRLAVGGRDR